MPSPPEQHRPGRFPERDIVKKITHPWVSLDSFEVDNTIQPRRFLSRDAVKRYQMAYRIGPDNMPPIKLGRLPDGRTILIDGFHRVAAAELVGHTRLRAETVPTTLEVAPWLAVEANIKNGVPIHRRQKRLVFRRFIEAGQNRTPAGLPMSSRAIASVLPIASHTSILTWIKADFPALYKEMTGEDGEDDLGEGEAVDQDRDQALADVSWAQLQLVTALAKARQHAPKAELADVLRSALADFEEALGRPLVTLQEGLDTIHGRRPEEDF